VFLVVKKLAKIWQDLSTYFLVHFYTRCISLWFYIMAQK